MKKQTFKIPNISCGHCTSAVENELREMKGIVSVKGDVKTKTAAVEWDEPASLEKILALLKEINYPAEL